MKKRVVLIDFVRILFAVLIFARHSIGMYKCVWFSDSFNLVINSLTSPIMSCFFVLSGFSIRMSSSTKLLGDGKSILEFYKKRLISILPPYYFLNICYALIIDDQMKDALILLPIQLFGISAPFRSLFGVFTNGGTWFVSCILIAYFLYPLFHQILSVIVTKNKLIVTAVLLCLRFYSGKIDIIYGLETNYANPFFRSIEFAIGVFLYDLCSCEYAVNNKKAFMKVSFGILVFTLLCCCGSEMVRSFFADGYVLVVLLFACVLYISLYLKCEILEKSKVLAYLSKLTYPFYLMQMISWTISANIFKPQTSLLRIVCSFSITFVSSVLVDKLTWYIKKYLQTDK